MKKTLGKFSDLSRTTNLCAQLRDWIEVSWIPTQRSSHHTSCLNKIIYLKKNHRRKKNQKRGTLKDTNKLLPKEMNLPSSLIAYLLTCSHFKPHVMENAPTQSLWVPQPFHQSWFVSDSATTNTSQEQNHTQTLPYYFSKQFPSPPNIGWHSWLLVILLMCSFQEWFLQIFCPVLWNYYINVIVSALQQIYSNFLSACTQQLFSSVTA